MRYRALATDFDGTIAHDGVVDTATLEALTRVKDAGLCLLLVTGRELPDLFNTFAHVQLFDRVVAENGVLMYTPETGLVRQLAPAPPVPLLDWLLKEGVPLSVGASIVERSNRTSMPCSPPSATSASSGTSSSTRAP